jgi:hypothetical protein
MSRLDEKLKASVKPTRGKIVAPAKTIASKPAPAKKPGADTKPAAAPARAGSNSAPANTSSLFPERIWPD